MEIVIAYIKNQKFCPFFYHYVSSIEQDAYSIVDAQQKFVEWVIWLMIKSEI